MKDFAAPLKEMSETIFTAITKLAVEHQATNLGQGFPDFDGPQWIKDEAIKAIQDGKNQYAPGNGILPLRIAISNNLKNFYGLNYSPDDVLVTVGATEAIYVTLTALLNPGDEVLVFEPFYDSYVASIQMARAVPRPVTLHSPEFKFDLTELKAAINPKTKAIIINSPHNPTGRVFDREELQTIADLAIAHDLFVISDEVYEFLVYDDNQHVPIASLKDMRERTITISSTGKTFGLTGWKVGWAAADQKILKAIGQIKQYITFCSAQPFQIAVAKGLENLNSYLPIFRSQYSTLRTKLVDGLKEIGLNVILPQGTYFCVVDLNGLTDKNDIEFCRELITKYKVAAIPASAFYLKSDEGSRLLRFCFAKQEATLDKALKNLSKLSF